VTLLVDHPVAVDKGRVDLWVTGTPVPDDGPRPRRVRRLARVTTERLLVDCIFLGLYLTVAALLDFHWFVFPGDANARMANGFYILYSNDPHLAAIGFVWNPLQSLADLFFLLFKDLWPALASNDMAASLVSVFCMVGAVHQVRAALQEWGVRRLPRLLMVAVFALNPMILFYAGNGMSEALYLFTLLATCRYLARWLRTDDVRSLAFAATALALCYLTRIEAVAPAILAGIVVFGVSAYRRAEVAKARVMAALTDTAVFLLPFMAAFVGWAIAGYAITGQAFSQLTSQYGTAQIGAAGYQRTRFVPGLVFEGHVLWYLAPLLPVIVAAAAVVAWRRRDALVLVVLAVCGGALLFDLAAYLDGGIINSFRYFIVTVPLEILLVGCMLATPPLRPASASPTSLAPDPPSRTITSGQLWPARHAGWVALAGTLVAGFLLIPSIPATATGMFNPKIGSEESNWLGFVVHGLEHRRLSATDLDNKRAHAWELALGENIADRRLPPGDVIVDNFDECITPMLTSVPTPKVFVIPNDRDFREALASPLAFHAHYMLVAPADKMTLIDNSIDHLYPTLYATGDGFATLVHQFPALGAQCPAYRLYRVVQNPSTVGAGASFIQ
jgi:hypothetical protein